MIINFVLPAIGTSGGVDVVYKYVELLKNEGHDVLVYKEVKASNMHRYTSVTKNWLHQIYCTVKAYIQKNKKKCSVDCYVWRLTDHSVRDADVIIATAWPTAYKVNALSVSKGKKFYFIQDYEIWDNEEWAKRTYMLPLQKIVISTWINNCLQRDLGIGPFPIVYNGLDISQYHKVRVYKDLESINFLMLNHVLPKKGVVNGLKAFEKIREKYPNCQLKMFGMCDGSNLPDYVEYHQNPPKSKIIELYSSSDIFIFPSIEEGWGLTPLEAMACGCVVVGTNTGFVQDIGLNKINMMISEPQNVYEMIKNIDYLLQNPFEVEKIRKNAYKLIMKLDWKNSVNKFEDIISKV